MSRRKQTIDVARAYDAPPPDGRFRVLVDRVWPRGIKKEALQLDQWMKDLAPTTSLRKWFHHDPARWDEFRARYFAESEANDELVAKMFEAAKGKSLLLLFGARDVQHNNAVALQEYLLKQTRR